MFTRILVALPLFLTLATSAPERLVEVKIADADGNVRTLGKAELESRRIVDKRAYLDTVWYAETQEFARGRKVPEKPEVVLFGGRGVFPPSLKAAVRRLDEARIPCKVIFSNTFDLPKGAVVVIPGGWAPSIVADLGNEMLRRLDNHNVLGICAGAYLMCSTVVWGGRSKQYLSERVKGVAIGPLTQIEAWPRAMSVRLDTGDRVVYTGGPSYGTKGTKVRARYPDGRAAIVEVNGVILCSVHCEVNARKDADLLADAAWPAAGDGRLFIRLVRDLMR
ncbi:MAG: hypothetical protein ACYTHK_09655 [Planctomycetota bacterium]|jgi:glutamine amidotransferase-like uncharacterized protein